MKSVSVESIEFLKRCSLIGLKEPTVQDTIEVMEGSDKKFETKTVSTLLHKFENLINNKRSIRNDLSTAKNAITY
jgi:hypothetical protein